MKVVDLHSLAGLEDAARFGAFHLRGHEIAIDRAIDLARRFFDLPQAEKRAIAQNSSYRGWSEMRGERDCREQLHFGPSENQWPNALGDEWREEILSLMKQLSAVGDRLLRALEVPTSEDPYLLLKLIHYPADDRIGVAPHCDFSWLTLILMDGPGLSMRDSEGNWHEVPFSKELLFVDIGELLELHSRGSFRAAPHRVRVTQSRLSLPFFVNPAADQIVEGARTAEEPFEHVHRVIPAGSARLQFGPAEHRRKVLGKWCYACCD